MKRRRQCEACRSRHRKCVFETGADECYGCREAGRSCISASTFILSGTVAGGIGRSRSRHVGISPKPRPPRHGGSEDDWFGEISPSSEQPSVDARSSLGLTRREADLFSLYTNRLAPMMDSCDEARRFTLVIPRLVFEEPMLLHSVLALASRYDALHRDVTPGLDATFHNNRCIELLIQALGKPPEKYSAELLAAVVMSRSYEECDFEADLNHHHLSGTKNLLANKAISWLASAGGLAEAAAWVHLRQAIYACLVRRHPLDSNFDLFEHLTTHKAKEVSPANHMVFLFAKILRLYFPSAEVDQLPASQGWHSLEAEVSAWFDTKPAFYEPIYSTTQDVPQDQFPVFIMAGALSVMALQYYHAATIMFSLREWDLAESRPAHETTMVRNKLERSIASALFVLMGLAVSNDHVEDAFLLPTHVLSLCGFCIQGREQRDLTRKFLVRVKKKVFWTTDSLIASLLSCWNKTDTTASS